MVTANTYARVPVVPGPVLEIFEGETLFPMTPVLAATWHLAPAGTIGGMIFDGTNFSPAPGPTAAQQWAAYQAAAKVVLEGTDTTMHRIAEGVSLGLTSWTAADVVAWVNYRRLLRVILGEAQPATVPTALPAQPTYPAGT